MRTESNATENRFVFFAQSSCVVAVIGAPCIRAFLSDLRTGQVFSKFPTVQIKKRRQFVDSASFVNNVKAQISRGLKTNMDANLFQVTEKADQMIQQFFQEKKEKPIVRVFLSQGG